MLSFVFSEAIAKWLRVLMNAKVFIPVRVSATYVDLYLMLVEMSFRFAGKVFCLDGVECHV